MTGVRHTAGRCRPRGGCGAGGAASVAPSGPISGAGRRRTGAASVSVRSAVGASTRRLGRARRRRSARRSRCLAGRSIGVEGATWLGRAFVVTGAAAVVSPALALLAGGGVTVAALGSRRAARRRAADAVVGALPEVIDLFGVAVGAGLPVAAAIGTVAGRSPPPIAGATP